MERHAYSVNFSASPSKARKTGLMPIFVTIRQNGERVTFTTGSVEGEFIYRKVLLNFVILSTIVIFVIIRLIGVI